MTRMLASAQNVAEVLLMLETGVDIIDLKQPINGALGALELDLIQQIVQIVQNQVPISATIGDLPMNPELIFNAVTATAATGVNYIKIGFFAEGNHVAVIEKLARLTKSNALIAVLFADEQPNFALIEMLAIAGFRGVMLDTANKQCGSLTEIMNFRELEKFVHSVHAQQLLCGLAGSLRQTDIPNLMQLQTDYLGFRGALCEQQQRVNSLNPQAILQIKALMG